MKEKKETQNQVVTLYKPQPGAWIAADKAIDGALEDACHLLWQRDLIKKKLGPQTTKHTCAVICKAMQSVRKENCSFENSCEL